MKRPGKRKQHTSTMWATGWLFIDGKNYPSVFESGAHKLWPVYPEEEMKKAPRRDIQFVKVTIKRATRPK